ncbi:MAG: hypothetical protein KC431_14955, partial [Myxococcales bacterium]|nr:hypothetical protein [Myxococcales bacterium]
MLIDRSSVLPRLSTGSEIQIDLLISVHRRNPDGTPGEILEVIWIVEVQMCRDRTRALAWSSYFNVVARAFGVDPACVEMLVVSPSVEIRGWLVHSLFPRMKNRPILLTRAHVPRLHQAQREGPNRIEPAVLSAIYHGRDPRNVAVVRTALAAIAPLEHVDHELYHEYRQLIRDAAHTDMTDYIQPPYDPVEEPALEPDEDDGVSEWEFEGLTWGQIRERLVARYQKEGLEQGLEQGLE